MATVLTDHTKPYRLLFIGLGLGVFFGLVDAVVDMVVEAGSADALTTTLLWAELFTPSMREMWIRSFVLGLFVLFAAYIAHERRRSDRQISALAFHDPITGLPNRTLLGDRLEHDLAHARRHAQPLALLFLDLDNFKAVNDACGHAEGDRLLAAVARRLSACLREEDTLARMGGDEFVVVLRNVGDSHRIAVVAQKLLDALAAPFPVCAGEAAVGASIGVAVCPNDGADSATLLKNADTAMYHVKAAGKNGYQFFTSPMNAQAKERLGMERSLREALAREEFVLHYELRFDPATRAMVGAEALLRWHHPERGLLRPSTFMGMVEEMGLAAPLGAWVLRTACRQAREWPAPDGGEPLRVSVSVSARQWQRDDFVDTVRQALAEADLPPAALELEIAEDALLRGGRQAVSKARVKLERLKALGVRLILGRFGRGPTGLSFLARLPFDGVKIEHGVIGDMLRHDADRAIADTVIALAHRLGLAVAAEGVDTVAQLTQLRDCDEAQGGCLGAPLPAERIGALLASAHRPVAV
jgi:diguanylate cyclase (GGDEF)-like protein